ncbi:hypothetical protein P691DRAFT_781888 [Macrolepiota fuliginosa MF-IS2]|uniref:Uncharacterized protein n=1 Tax=Macrolepiota fuliginosa MF-IS2 TaxID=1400762 RepID=A0A9P5WXB6_9AGAR|nr:hypothetical protein P691DRAFT_781888 [Macrolepiota fuliginosa MF-IS2]
MQFVTVALAALAFLISQTAASPRPEPQGSPPIFICNANQPCKSSFFYITNPLTNVSNQVPLVSTAVLPQALMEPVHSGTLGHALARLGKSVVYTRCTQDFVMFHVGHDYQQ